jgi:hypothetical protein
MDKSILWLGKSLQIVDIGDIFTNQHSFGIFFTRQTEGYANPLISNSLSETLTLIIADTKEDRINNYKVLKKYTDSGQLLPTPRNHIYSQY